MRLLIAKSTFDHPETDDLVSPGQPLVLEDAMAESMTRRLLAEPPRPDFHYNVEAGPKTPGGRRTAVMHKGGGAFVVALADDGTVLNEDETVRGRDAVDDFVANLDNND